jgi:quinol monooxygenase YgiN
MITEIIRYRISSARASAFEEAYHLAEEMLRESEHCLGYELLRSIEEPENWVLLIRWDSVEGHEQGFRRRPGFAEFFKLVEPFFQQIQEMKHYECRIKG